MTATLQPPPTVSAPGRRVRTKTAAAAPGHFRVDIEGIRGVALLMVLIFHSGVPGFEGGFIGLDVFFVLSGFLITGQLIAEIDKTGRVRLGAFYARRARRIIPAAAVVLIATAIAGYFLLPALRSYRLTADLLSSALYYANWHFIGQGNDYLALTYGESAAQHFWSLSVEEQFYLVWPLLLVFGALLARAGARNRLFLIALVLGIVTVASFAVSAYLANADPGVAYMGTHSRAWQFGVGGLLALGAASVADFLTRHRWLAHLIGLVGLAGMFLPLLWIDRSTPYPGIAALPSTIGGVALVMAGPASLVGRTMSFAPFRLVGRWSYAWYLWHWPLLIGFEERYGPQTWQVDLALCAAAGVLAGFTYLLVERPIRRSRTLAKRMPAAGSLGLTATVLAATVVLVTGSLTAHTLGATNEKADQATFDRVFGAGAAATSGSVTPSPLRAEGDLPNPPDCIVDHTSVQKNCVFGTVGGRSIVLVGDSHAHQWQPAFQDLAELRGWQLTVIAKAGCPIADIAPRDGDDSRLSSPECPTWRREQLDRIEKMRPDLIIATNLRNYIPEVDEIGAAWNKTLDSFRRSGAEIAYLRDTPAADFDIPECVADSLDDWSRCAFPAPTFTEPIVTGVAAGKIDDVKILDLNGYLCDGSTCPVVRNGTLLYRDNAHLTATAVRLLDPAVSQAMIQAGLW